MKLKVSAAEKVVHGSEVEFGNPRKRGPRVFGLEREVRRPEGGCCGGVVRSGWRGAAVGLGWSYGESRGGEREMVATLLVLLLVGELQSTAVYDRS